MVPETPIRWDIVEEHLDEAGFMYQLWEEALRSPVYTLPEIAEGPEERLLAHLDGLILGGPAVAKKLLVPALAGDEPGQVFAAAFALLAEGPPEHLAVVLAALERAEPAQRAAIRRALQVVPRPDLGQRLAGVVAKAPAIQADLLDVLGYLRVDPGVRLESLVNTKNSASEAIAVRLARVFPARLEPAAIDRALASPVAEVRAAALETAAVLAHRGAVPACEATVATRGPAFGTAALLLALSGEEKCLPQIVAALAEPRLQREAAFALGFSGRVSAADALLEAMVDEKLAAVAGEGFAAITGLAIEKGFAKPPEPWNPDAEEEEDEEYGPEAELAKPEPDAIAAWWKEARPRLDPAQRRWLRGRPWAGEAVFRELEQGPARRHETLALDLAVRTRGQVQLTWDAMSARQTRELAEAKSAATGRITARSYGDAIR